MGRRSTVGRLYCLKVDRLTKWPFGLLKCTTGVLKCAVGESADSPPTRRRLSCSQVGVCLNHYIKYSVSNHSNRKVVGESADLFQKIGHVQSFSVHIYPPSMLHTVTSIPPPFHPIVLLHANNYCYSLYHWSI